MKIEISNRTILINPPENFAEIVADRLTFTNPKWIENDRRGYSNGHTAKILKFYEIDSGDITLPRGFARQLLSLCRKYNVNYQLQDAKCVLPDVSFSFKGAD